MDLVWSPEAVDDLNAAADYIEFELAITLAAKRHVESVIEKAELFADTPGAGMALRTARGIDTGYRYLLCGNWMVFLEHRQDRAIVVRVLYAKSNYMKTLFGEVGN